MIRGRFRYGRGRWRPFVNATLAFPALGRSLNVPLLVDTGADRTVLGPRDVRRLNVDQSALTAGQPSIGVGGQMRTHVVDAVLTLGVFSIPLSLTLLDSPPGPVLPIPSLLGRDVLARFALVLEERTGRVLLLEPHEADALSLP